MATLALSVVGTVVGGAIGGPFGAAVGRGLGAMAGAYIDSQLFASKPKPIVGPRIEDLKVTSAAYGTPIAIGFGQRVRSGGTVIWNTNLLETANSTRAKSGKGGSKRQTTTTFSYSISAAVLVAEGPIGAITRIWGDGKLWYDAAQSPPQVLADGVRIYLGTEAQTADPLIAAVEGAANTPAYRGSAYIVIEDLQLANFANRLPRMEIEWEPGGQNVAGALDGIARRVGVTTLDAASVGNALPGFVIARQTSARAAIEELSAAYGLVGASQPGGLVVKPRGVAATGGMDTASLGAGSERPGEAQPWRLARAPTSDIPREVSLTFMDATRDYQTSTVTSRRAEGVGQGTDAYAVAAVLAPDEAQARVEQIHADLIATQNTADSLMLPPSFAQVTPGDALFVELDGATRRLTLTKVTSGANGLVEVSATEEIAGTWLPYTAVAPAPTVPVQAIPAVVPTTLHLLDLPMLTAQDDDAGFYYAVGGAAGWRSAAVIRSSDDVNFAELAYSNLAATIGTCQTTLADGPWLTTDLGNTLDVLLLAADDALESVTDGAIFNGANGAVIGGEIVQFRTATLIAPSTYRLSGFERGRLGTDHLTATHVAAERFVFLGDLASIERIVDPLSLRNASRFYRGVSLYQDAAAVVSQSFANSCAALRPWSPVDIAGTRDGGNNLTVTWTRRSRIPFAEFFSAAPLGEATEAYEVDIRNAGDTATLRTIAATSPTASYTAAQQTADGLTPGNPVVVRVQQISASIGRGVSRRATV
jgi:hypothetical protein